nr:hypothetical protein [Tanacetum cinerariifolium]
MLRAFPVSLTGVASRWISNQPSGSIRNWEVLKTKFLNKYCPPAHTAKKMEEINTFQQESDESLFRAWERFKELLIKSKRHEENSNIIKEIQASTDAAIRNQGASIKTLELQIKQMSKALQKRGFGSLPSSTETNPRDQVKSISTPTSNLSEIRRIEHNPYAVSCLQHIFIFPKTVPFLRQLHNYCCDYLKEARGVSILGAYDNNLPQKERDPGSFTLPCLINNICFDKGLIDLGASVSVMPLSTYTKLSIGDLSHTRMTIELANRTIKQPKCIVANVLVRIGKFVFPIEFIILDIPEDDDVPLILG